MQLGEVIFGGVGCGAVRHDRFVIVAVFLAGLMVGRTPEYLGKKIEALRRETRVLVVLVRFAILGFTALAVAVDGASAA